jgi:glycosyltransferase involved in cell wall biosynthesis
MISLRTVGGIERNFSQFVNARAPGFEIDHHTILTRRRLARPIADDVVKGSRSVRWLKHWMGIRIPAFPKQLRDARLRHLMKTAAPDALILWSNPRILASYRTARLPRIVYYDRGASWFNRDAAEVEKTMKTVSGVLCNSFAAKRMLETKWGMIDRNRVRVCLNAVRPDCLPSQPQRPRLMSGDLLRIGVAGRLEPIKGIPLALHGLKSLADRGIDSRLLVAGDGSERSRLEALARRLSVSGRVQFLGFVDKMTAFFEAIDVFLCPSVREPFGLVCAEAMAHGVPVVGASVDGIPEVIDHQRTGICLKPRLDIGSYPLYGGRMEGLPDRVYLPEEDRIGPPGLVSPEDIADALEWLIRHPAVYQEMSRQALLAAGTRFDYRRHVTTVIEALRDLLSSNHP